MAGDEADPTTAVEPPREFALGRASLLIAIQAIAMVTIGHLLWNWSGSGSTRFLSFTVREVGQGVVLGLALILIAYALFRCFPRASEALVRMQAGTYGFLGPTLPLPAIVFISLCAGIGEEALFRGGLQTILGDYVGPLAAMALSSGLFAALHLGKPVITALLFVVGCTFGAVFWFTGSLLAVMIGHALYDIWALRYLHREFLRLGLVGDDTAPLANPASGG